MFDGKCGFGEGPYDGGKLPGEWQDWIARSEWVSCGLELGKATYALAIDKKLTAQQVLYLVAKNRQFYGYVYDIDRQSNFDEYLLVRAIVGHRLWGQKLNLLTSVDG